VKTAGALTPERFAQGMTFEQYLTNIGTPENLEREAGWWLGPQRRDWSARLRAWSGRLRLSDAQVGAIRWLAAQPNGPARVLVISEEWSSDCRRDLPMLAHLAEAGGLELRIFTRDGHKVGRGPRATRPSRRTPTS
jgi:Thioredoxin